MIATLLVKSTLALLIAMLSVVALQRSRASLRHLVLASAFAFLLLLPFVQKLAPRWEIEVAENRSTAVRELIEVRSTTPVQPRTSHTNIPWTKIYLAGSALLLAWLSIGVLRLRKLARDGEVWLDGTSRVHEIALESNIRRSALVILSHDITSPMTAGRSTILLPFAAREWSHDALTRALRHELEHVRREDWLLQLVARATLALYWLHPLAWIAWRRFCLEAERACDDAVIDSCAAPDVYATQLVALARDVRRMHAMPALGMASRSKLAVRVSAILDPSQPRGRYSRGTAMTTLIVALALLVSIAPAQLVAAAAAQILAPIVDRSGNHALVAEHLIESAKKGDLIRVRELLDSGVDVNTSLPGDGTALIAASRGAHLELMTFLIERGADVNLSVFGDGNPLIAAAQAGSVEAVRTLLEHGAAIDELVPGDENALIQAAAEGHADVVRFLIDKGADVNAATLADGRDWRTPLRMARRGGFTDIEEMLIRAGAKR